MKIQDFFLNLEVCNGLHEMFLQLQEQLLIYFLNIFILTLHDPPEHLQCLVGVFKV